MSELKPCQMSGYDAIKNLEELFGCYKCCPAACRSCAGGVAIAAIKAECLSRAQPGNEPMTPEKQWMETASDNTDYVLAYADGIYCVTDADGHVICEFMRRTPERNEP